MNVTASSAAVAVLAASFLLLSLFLICFIACERPYDERTISAIGRTLKI